MIPVLKVNNLSVILKKEKETKTILDNVHFEVDKGKKLAIIGESGSGKTITALSILNLLPKNFEIMKGEIIFNGVNLLNLAQPEMQKIRGKKIAMIFQEPLSSLNPLLTVGYQIYETLLTHNNISQKEAKSQSINLLKKVGFDNLEEIYSKYPHQLSGGMRQRIVIAIGISNNPDILIADEPTSSLDITSESEIIILLKSLNKNENMAIIFITHDLRLAKDFVDDIIVMYNSEVVEQGSVNEIFENPKHQYTKELLSSCY
jgi:ABC-type dipeptide/oligopeptide/nickel transport system ATPase component